MRNPNWHRDEIILALDLYFQLEPGQIHSRNPKVVELSGILNKLPIHDWRPDEIKFRNPNGVGLKLSNFLAIDPNYAGKGMQSSSQLDKAVFLEFANKRSELAVIANQIRAVANNEVLRNTLYKIEEDRDDLSLQVREGRVIYKLHKHLERDHRINKEKKTQYFRKTGRLDCEACGFDFHRGYGDLGKGYIECHHIRPLFEIQEESITTLKDLALVCSNCHRMLHRKLDTLSIVDLKGQVLFEYRVR